MEKAGLKVARPDSDPFRKAIGPAVEKIGKYTGEDYVKDFHEICGGCKEKVMAYTRRDPNARMKGTVVSVPFPS